MSVNLDTRSVLITGGTGFIGRQLVAALLDRKATVYALVRKFPAHPGQKGQDESGHHQERAPFHLHPNPPPSRGRELDQRLSRTIPWPPAAVTVRLGDLGKADSLENVCAGVDTVFHLAGCSEEPEPGDKEDLHWRVTVEGTRRLLQEAARSGVKRFIYASSVKAMGEGGDSCLDETSPAVPLTSYGRAKLEAERLVLEAGMKHGMHMCNLRLPPVYGRDNRGNLWRMIVAIDRGRFPPLPEVGNRRSLVHVDDVVQALQLAADNPAAQGKTYIVTDGCAYSTHQIYAAICASLGRPVPRWTMPVALLRAVAKLGDAAGRALGKKLAFNSEILGKLIGSAWYSSRKIEQELGYRPIRLLEQGLREMVATYRQGAAS